MCSFVPTLRRLVALDVEKCFKHFSDKISIGTQSCKRGGIKKTASTRSRLLFREEVSLPSDYDMMVLVICGTKNLSYLRGKGFLC